MTQRLAELLRPHGVEQFGVVSYEDCLPLLPCRGVQRIPPGAQSVVVCLFPYHIGEFPHRNVARYAVLADYHQVAGEILRQVTEALQADHPAQQFAAFVDSSPIREVAAAQRAGLGVIGWHGQLISPQYGARVFIGTVVTTLALPVSQPSEGGCLDCGLCVSACPTGALRPPEPLNKPLCRSFLTQKKGTLTPWEAEQVRLGGMVWGCDLCVDACPMNTTATTPIPGFYRHPVPVLTPDSLGDDPVEKPYHYRGPQVLIRNHGLINNN